MIAYNRGNSPRRRTSFELVIGEDPSIVDAYLFAAGSAQDQPTELKKAFELAAEGGEAQPRLRRTRGSMVGKLASKIGDKRIADRRVIGRHRDRAGRRRAQRAPELRWQ